MKITEQWLKKKSACPEGIGWFKAQDARCAEEVIKKLIIEDKLTWANWLVVRVLGWHQKIQYAAFAAEQGIDIYEKQYPNDKRSTAELAACKAAWSAWSVGSAESAARLAESAARLAGLAADVGKKEMTKILNYGVTLL